MTFEFRILGPLEVEGDQGPVALGGGKQRALLGLLLLHANDVLSSERLVDELWGERPPRTAATSLHNLLSQLRRLLGAEVVVTRSPGYVLRVPPDRIDAKRFEQLVGEARKAPPEERGRLLREALALWRGNALADFALETFAQGEIRRLEERRLEALEERVEADLEVGLGPELVAELESLVERNPLRERLRRQLMLALYRSSRQAEALDLYHATRTTLAEELGIDPSPALQQLYASILRQESALSPSAAAPRAVDHYGGVADALLAGRLVTVLGAGVNLRNGHAGAELPTLGEIAAHLARRFDCPPGNAGDLARVSQFVALTKGVGPLYDELHSLLDHDLEPGPAHHLVARTATLLRERELPRQLVVTANFDHALERAFAEAGEPVDVVSYIALGRHRGKFLHVTDEGETRVVDVPNAYAGLSPEDRTVILKVHGQVDRRPEREWESFVVSEDDHIDYLARAEISSLVPVTLVARLRRSHFLFLGYPLHDWGLRVFLHRIWGHEEVAYRSWAVEREPAPLARELWRQRGVEMFDVPLDEYVSDLGRRLSEATRTAAA